MIARAFIAGLVFAGFMWGMAGIALMVFRLTGPAVTISIGLFVVGASAYVAIRDLRDLMR